MSEDMRLWLLRPRNGLPHEDNPWNPWYDKAFGFVIRAETEQRAREMAHKKAGDENRGEFLGESTANTTSPWLDPDYSTCVVLTAEGPEGVVIEDFAAA